MPPHPPKTSGAPRRSCGVPWPRALVFETVPVCAVTLLPPLRVSTLMASSPTMFRHAALMGPAGVALGILQALLGLLLVRYILFARGETPADRKSTRLNSSHDQISYAVFCLKKKTKPSASQALTHITHLH